MIQSIRAAGKVGLPVVEYNFYAHRAMEGYFEETGRAGAGLDRLRLRADEGPAAASRAKGAHTLDEMWANITYFLKAVVPEAEKAGVRLALHPNDPPAPDEPRLAADHGHARRLEEADRDREQPVERHHLRLRRHPGNGRATRSRSAATSASRDRINHVHFRNVKVQKPYEHYTEVFIDEGENDMFAVMKELVKHKYTRLIYPEHPRGIDYDRERPAFRPQYPGGGGYAAYAFNVGYTRAMLQAATGASR